ncbi:MAG: right-handed parallel beta-helix repeat-containing protein [Parafilimonas sp.]|nr:right-handed parallel beta-helix repeat-containing protein [Parafilimonas sp.]
MNNSSYLKIFLIQKYPLIFLLCVLYANSFCKPSNHSSSQPINFADTTIHEAITDASLLEITLRKTNCKGHKIYATKGGNNGIYIDGSGIKAGDTIVLSASANPYSYFAVGNLYGTKDCPITIINEGGQVYLINGMAIDNSRFVNITGTGDAKENYGFKIEDPNSNGVGIDIHGRSSNIEVQHIFIHNKTYGFWVKQEGSCIDSLQFPNWIIRNIFIHDNKIVKMNQEGMYLGSTDPNGARDIQCNGHALHPKPLHLGNIKVYNNIVDSTNRSGIQLSCGSEMMNEIFNNTVTNCGFEMSDIQGNGISLGGYSNAKIYNNKIDHTYALGIMCLGSGKILIKDNTIDNSGNLNEKKANGMAGIMIDTRPTNPVDSTNFFILNNKIGSNTDHSIRVYKTVDSYAKANVICNNSGNAEVAKGVDWTNCTNKK